MTISGYIRFLGQFSMVVVLLALVGCSYKPLDKAADSPAKAQKIEIERRYQIVKKFNCEGRLVEEEWETTESPTYHVKIDSSVKEFIKESEFYNRTTRSRPTCNVGLHKFTIDMVPSWCNMHVLKGINEIDYKFYNMVGLLVESGTVYIDVGYSEYFSPHPKTEYPDRDTCYPPKRSTTESYQL